MDEVVLTPKFYSVYSEISHWIFAPGGHLHWF
jgi:hypothetical protein